MNTARTATVTLGLAVGSAIAVAAYGAIAPPATAPTPVLAAVAEPKPVAAPTTVVYDPCVAPAKLEKGVCVTHKVKTVVVSVAAPNPAPVQRREAPTTATPAATNPPPQADQEQADHPDEDRDHADEDRDHADEDDHADEADHPDEDRDHAEEDDHADEDHEDHEDEDH